MKLLRGEAGFTLLEVVVATLILAMSFAVLLPIFGSAPARLEASKQAAFAQQLVSTQLEHHVLLEDWNSFPVSGELDDWIWELSLQAIDEPNGNNTSGYALHISAQAWQVGRPEYVWASIERIVWVKNS